MLFRSGVDVDVANTGGADLLDVAGVVFQALEECLPVRIDRGRIAFIPGVKIVDIGGVGALQKRG